MFSRRLWMAVPLVALAALTARADNPRTQTTLTCQIYALGELCDDGQFGAWIAKTIPEVIEPKSWTTDDAAGKRVLTYNPTAKVMVVYQTPKVHDAIAGFLKNVRQTMPVQTRSWAKNASVVQAAHAVPVPAKFADPAPLASSSPMRTMADRPPHLFHIILEGLEGKGTTYKLKNFTLRYEGDGIIDPNIVELIRTQAEIAARNSTSPSPGESCPGGACPPAPAPKSDPSYSESAFQQLMRILPFQTYSYIEMPKTTSCGATLPSGSYHMVPPGTPAPAMAVVPVGGLTPVPLTALPCPAACPQASSASSAFPMTTGGTGVPQTPPNAIPFGPGTLSPDDTLPGLPPRPAPIRQAPRPMPREPEPTPAP